MKIAIILFPGSNCDHEAEYVVKDVLGHEAELVWHGRSELGGADAVVLPGGFSHGDYLRAGAIARFSPVMGAVTAFAKAGGPVLGICNGFQILLEAGLLEGATLRNRDLQFHCEHVFIRVEQRDTPFTRRARPGQILKVPIAHGEGAYYAPPDVLERLEGNGQVVFRYCSATGEIDDAFNPNGSVNGIAGLSNDARNVVGLMPHPERACEAVLGSSDGLVLFESLLDVLRVSGGSVRDEAAAR